MTSISFEMSFSDYGGYLSVIALLYSIGLALDTVSRPTLKAEVAQLIELFAAIPRRALSFHLYCMTFMMSVLMSIIIVLNVGGLESLADRSFHFLASAKSAGPLLLTLTLKAVLWDFLVAAKSAHFWRLLKTQSFAAWIKVLLIVADIIFSTLVTALFVLSIIDFQKAPAVQSSGIAQMILPSITNIFNEVSVFSTYAIQVSLYWLNGSIVFYVLAGMSWLASPESFLLDEISVKKHPFTIMVTALTIICFVVLSCALFVGKR